MKPLARSTASRATLATLFTFGTLTVSPGVAFAIPPRSERVAARIAERAYARQSIAEARAARAEARVAEIAPLVPVPPPPRPATVRRMARAGVPLAGAPPLVVPSPLVKASPPSVPTGPAVAHARPDAPRPVEPALQPGSTSAAAKPATPTPTPAADVAEDGTRSVLTTAEEPAPTATAREAAGGPVTHPPIELLPTPQPQ